MITRNMVSMVKRCLIVFIGVSLGAWCASLHAGSPYVSGTIERIYSAKGNRFIQVDGQAFLVNKETCFDIMRGKQLIKNVPIKNLRHGFHVRVLVSDWEGKQWAKNILVVEDESNTPIKAGQMSVPVLSPP